MLQFVTRATPAGRPFTRHLYDLQGSLPKHFTVRLSAEARAAFCSRLGTGCDLRRGSTLISVLVPGSVRDVTRGAVCDGVGLVSAGDERPAGRPGPARQQLRVRGCACVCAFS